VRHRPAVAGPAIRHGLFAIVVDADIQGGLAALVGASAVGLALAAGVTLGEYLGRPVTGGRDRYDQRVRRRTTTADRGSRCGCRMTRDRFRCVPRHASVESLRRSHLNARQPEQKA
jgi:hypothetical protein